MLHLAEVAMETTRGRLLGTAAVVLIDASWELADCFIRAHSLRSTQNFELLKFTYEEQNCRCRVSSLQEAAEVWINQAMDVDTAGDYATAKVLEEVEEQQQEPHLPVTTPEETLNELALLKQKIAELELQALDSAAMPRTPSMPGFSRAGQAGSPPSPGVLFGARPPVATEDGLQRLQQLAGGVPSRLGAHERQAREGRPEQILEALQQEESLEATAGQELEEGLQDLEAAQLDPLQRMMLLQMKQIQLLTKQAAPRQHDPIHVALGGGGSSEGSSSSGGIKGCLAREAFIKVAADLDRLGELVQRNASEELGLDALQPHPGLMRDYIEKRTPLADHRLLTQMAYIMASGWEIGFRSGNKKLQGFCCRTLMFIDQTANDAGRTNLSWLLTALPEPNFALTQKNRVRGSMVYRSHGWLNRAGSQPMWPSSKTSTFWKDASSPRTSLQAQLQVPRKTPRNQNLGNHGSQRKRRRRRVQPPPRGDTGKRLSPACATAL